MAASGLCAAAVGLLLAGCTGIAPPLKDAAVAPVTAEAKPLAPAPTAAELAARPEPHTAVQAAAIEAELQLIAERRAASADPREIAALEVRAKELKRLAAAQAGPLRP